MAPIKEYKMEGYASQFTIFPDILNPVAKLFQAFGMVLPDVESLVLGS
jgi:hypothetical protein